MGGATEDSGKSIVLVNKIRDHLARVTGDYEKQNYVKTEELATKAYLENFESIESDLALQDQKLMEDTEVLLRQELRRMTKDNKTIDEVQTSD